MATYEYYCPICRAKETVIRGINEPDPGYECKNCKVKLNQVFGSVAVSFKGNGWAHKE